MTKSAEVIEIEVQEASGALQAPEAPESRPFEKPYLSASSINTWLQCPRAWAYSYVRGQRPPGSGATAQGNVWHEAVAHGYREAMAGRPLPSVADLQDMFAGDLKERLLIGLSEPESSKQAVRLRDGEKQEELLAEGLALTKAHREEIAPIVVGQAQVVAVEERIQVSLGDAFPFDLVGYLDVVTRDAKGIVTIRDNKSRSKRRGAPKQADLDRDVQLTMYALLWRASRQETERALTLDCVIKQGLGADGAALRPKTKIAETWRMAKDLQWLLGMIEQMARAVWAEAYPPCAGPSAGWWCSEKWCDHWKRCMDAHDWPGAGERLRDLPKVLEV